MRIMLINHYAGSPEMGMEYRPYYLSNEWKKEGHDVIIIAADNAHVRNIQPKISKSFEEQEIEGIPYLWVKTPEYSGNSYKRVLNMLSFVRQLKKKAKSLAEKYKPDVVIASSTYPMDNYAAFSIAKYAKANYFYEVHDLWPLSPMELGGYKASHPFIKYIQRAEDFAYRNADGVISMLPLTKDYMITRGLDPEKWNYVPNGIVPVDTAKDTELPEKLQQELLKIKEKHAFSIVYAGSHGIANALDNLLSIAKELPKFAFVLFGEGQEKLRLQEKYSNTENLFFFNAVPKTQMQNLLAVFDVAYIGLKKQSLFRFGISPNKIFDYMMAGIPIIQSISAGNDLVKDANCGISVEGENPRQVLDAIQEM
ncbi:MAG TPA: glycosyltransferase WbuB, partial [Bacteroidetes bacterium]|nr:glycosyltransferase WbuB [Bacteroidota bacterium]